MDIPPVKEKDKVTSHIKCLYHKRLVIKLDYAGFDAPVVILYERRLN